MPKRSVDGSPSSAIRAVDPLPACAAAAEELADTRRFANALDAENTALRTSLDTERRLNASLTELSEARRREGDALRNAVTAQAETIAAKNDAIAAQRRLIDELKPRRSSLLRRIGDIAIGIAAGALLR